MALAPIEKVALGSIAFALFWVLAVSPQFLSCPLGGLQGSLLGAMLMVIFKVITPEEAYSAIDLSILGLLFGTMVVSIYLESADMFKYLGKVLSWKSMGPKDLLCRICLVSAISSALFTNDTSCVVLTEFVLKIARQNNIPPHPFLLALASSANIGSSATPIGNPQNLVIAIQGKISFGEFLLGIFPAMLVGALVNALLLLCMYWGTLSVSQDEANALAEVISEEDANAHRFSPATMLHLPSPNYQEPNSIPQTMSLQLSPDLKGNIGHTETTLRNRNDSIEINMLIGAHDQATGNSNPSNGKSSKAKSGLNGSTEMMESGAEDKTSEQYSVAGKKTESWFKGREKLAWKTCVYLVTIGMLVALLVGLNMSWTALSAALFLVVLDFKDARPCLDKVSYSLLIFFCGMFITVDGFNKTGIPSTLWNLTEPYARINHAVGVAVLTVVILVLSNVVSNVPTVLLLGARVAASAAAISWREEKKAWLVLAWASTVAGNLSLLGSAANLIVCEQARRAKSGYTLSFWSHLKFGLPSTIIVTAIGLTLIRG